MDFSILDAQKKNMIRERYSILRRNFLKLSFEEKVKYYGILAFMCVGLGILLGFLTFNAGENLLWNILGWIAQLALGSFIYMGSWILSFVVFNWKFEKEIHRHLRYSFIPVNLIFVAIFLMSIWGHHSHEPITETYNTTWYWAAPVMWVQVLGVCIIVELFLSISGFLNIMQKVFAEDKKEWKEKETPLQHFITIENTKIPIQSISHVTVENNFCTMVYLDNSTVKSIGTYTNLTFFENQCPPTFLRINRSTLINPEMIVAIEKINRQYEITMKGDDSQVFLVSRSKSDLILSTEKQRLGLPDAKRALKPPHYIGPPK